MTKKIKMYMGIPTVGTVCDAQQYALRSWEKNYGDQIEFVYPDVCIRRIFHDFARNGIVEDFLKTDCDVLCFLDSDISPCGDMLDLYLKYYEEWSCAGAAYPVFMSQPGRENQQIVYTVYKGSSDQGLAPTDIPASGTEYVDGIATGCIFIKRHVLEAMERPWFKFTYDEESRKLIGGEDISFCKKVGAMGYKFFIDYAKTCKHYKTVCLLEVNNYAAEYARASVNNYADMIKGQINSLNEYVQKLKSEVKELRGSKSRLIVPRNYR